MKRLTILLLIAGVAMLLFGVTAWSANTGLGAVAYAGLPEDHPPIPQGNQVPTTPNDYYLPGTQPGMLDDEITPPWACVQCHKDYGDDIGMPEEQETWRAWSGSMMAQAGRDPLFWAALDIAEADAKHSGEFCLRCHLPSAFLDGAVTGTSTIDDFTSDQLEGVECAVCHRMVDAIYEAGVNPERDAIVLQELADDGHSVTDSQSGSYIVDTLDERRGPFELQDDYSFNPHATQGIDWPLQSPYHQEAALCGTCHDITNPVLTWNETLREYLPNDNNTPSDLTDNMPIERTYSEWLLSDYNTAAGIYAPEFGGNKSFVSTCQDCHLRDIDGMGGWIGPIVGRTDNPLHDMTGGNTWVPQTIPLHPNPIISDAFTSADPLGEARLAALQVGIERARYMLQNAADVTATLDDNELTVKITNNTGHKLPTGYPEGRRMWVQVEGYDANDTLIYASGAYSVATGVLTMDDDIMVYEVNPGITENLAAIVDKPAGESFHFVLNNVIIKDNRIPPRGYEFTAYEAAQAAPMTDSAADATRYADGQYWDEVVYTLPEDVVRGEVRLLYQTSSKEYIEFLRDNTPFPDDPMNNGAILFDLWEQTNRSAPEVMADVPFSAEGTPAADFEYEGIQYPGNAISFTNLSTGAAPITYEWDFGDGSATSIEENPIHIYATPGTYTVTLTATNIVGSNSYELTITISDWKQMLPIILNQ